MLVDLEELQARSAGAIRSKVCIIGAGVAGNSLAHRLAEAGISVALLEARGRSPEDRKPEKASTTRAWRTWKTYNGTHERALPSAGWPLRRAGADNCCPIRKKLCSLRLRCHPWAGR